MIGAKGRWSASRPRKE